MQADTAVASVQHSAGTDKQALPTRWRLYGFPTSVNTQTLVPTGTVCEPVGTRSTAVARYPNSWVLITSQRALLTLWF